MSGAFERLARSVLTRLGEDASLVSGLVTTTVRANIEHGVQVTGSYDDAVMLRDILTLEKSAGAKVGDTLIHPEGTYRIDGLLLNNGYTQRFTLQPI